MNKLASLLLLFFCSIQFYGETWYQSSLTIIDRTSDDIYTKVTLNDVTHNHIVVKYTSDFTQRDAIQVERAVKIFTSWTDIKYELIKFSFTENNKEIVVLPDSLSVNGKELISNLPSGMLFYMRDTLEYDFRITTGEFFLRIKGVYINQNELFTKIKNALEKPENYIERHDPEYYLAKINTLTVVAEKNKKDLDALKRYLINKHSLFIRVPESLIDQVINIKSAHMDYQPDEILNALKEKEIKASLSQIKTITLIYYGEK